MLYRSLVRPLLFRLPAETAHELALHSLALAPELTARALGNRYKRNPFGKLRRFGLTFANPVGLAAGFDKNGVALPSLAALGFGFIEAGTVTFHAQPGNPRPRLCRLPQDQALINRAGFNNDGSAAIVKRIEGQRPDCVLGISIGKSKITPIEKAVDDYLKSFELVHAVADYVAINVSSPNTAGLRDLQRPEQLEGLLKALQERNEKLSSKAGRSTLLPLLVKISPDLTDDELSNIVSVARNNRIDGLIATNTTTSRAGLRSAQERVKRCGDGGLSGAPLKAKATEVVAKLFRLTRGSMPVIGVGGIFNADDAWQMIAAGASLIQIYTGFIYQGPTVARDINDGLRQIVSQAGFVSLDEAVGCRVEEYCK